MARSWPLVLALAALVVGPILLRPRGEDALFKGDDELIVISPHNEAVRAEFGRGFRDWYQAKTGRSVRVDFRTPGGTSEIKRFIQGKYVAAFKNEWTRKGHEWSSEVERDFMNAKLKLDDSPGDDTPGQSARRAWLASSVSCDHDVFFGGGAIDFIGMADEGSLVDSGFVSAHPELFNDGMIPQTLGGEQIWDTKGRWIGTTLGAFGIAFNRDQLKRLGLPEPQRWSDLGDPHYFRALALANPTQSSSANKAFEMLIQQQMNEAGSTEEGWARAMRLLQRIGANARYWSDFSSKIALDVESGEAAAGMTIDFYGRYQAGSVRRADGTSRIGYNDAYDGTSYGADPVAILRGAPHPELARQFIDFLLSPEGQKLWGWKVGAPGGPKVNAQYRYPILRTLYVDNYREYMSFEGSPYKGQGANTFTYRGERTGRLFDAIRFTIRVMCIDTHTELAAAWDAIIHARRANGELPPEALAAFHDNAVVDYAAVQKVIQPATARDANKITQVQLAKTLADTFRQNYRRAQELAHQGR